jgi:transcriptional regulator with XRE-family HTH domain
MPRKGNPHVNRAFGTALREFRIHRGIAQEALAALAELDRTYISTLELGQSTPKLDTMLALAKALDLELATLIARVEEILRRQ